MLGHLIAFGVASALIVLLPGPDTLVVLRSLVRAGRPAVARTAAGVLAGLTVWVVAASLGISALLRASHDGYAALRLVGAAYLLVLGVQAWRSRGGVVDLEVAEPGAATGRRLRGALGVGFRAGLLTDLLNPKVGVFFVSFLPAFIPAGAPTNITSLGLGAVFIAETALYFAVFVRGADRILRALARPRSRRVLERTTGTVLIGFGLRLATER